jgi:hypothetical protein
VTPEKPNITHIAGGLLAIVLVVLTAGVLWRNSIKVPTELCKLSTRGARTMAVELIHGRPSEEIVGLVASTSAAGVCKKLITDLNEHPYQQATFMLEAGSNGELQQSVSRAQLIAPPPALPHTFGRFSACASSYDIAFLRQLCFDGKLDP